MGRLHSQVKMHFAIVEQFSMMVWPRRQYCIPSAAAFDGTSTVNWDIVTCKRCLRKRAILKRKIEDALRSK